MKMYIFVNKIIKRKWSEWYLCINREQNLVWLGNSRRKYNMIDNQKRTWGLWKDTEVKIQKWHYCAMLKTKTSLQLQQTWTLNSLVLRTCDLNLSSYLALTEKAVLNLGHQTTAQWGGTRRRSNEGNQTQQWPLYRISASELIAVFLFMKF